VEIKPENIIKKEDNKEESDTKTTTAFSNEIDEPELDELDELMNEKLKLLKEEVSARTILDSSNFENGVKHGYTFVKFYAPWCGHCIEMAPDWNDLANYYFKHPINGVDLKIAEVDCTQSPHVCMDQGVEGYPSIKLYRDGSAVEDYFFSRTLDRMRRFLAEKLIDIEQIETNSIGVFTLNDVIFTTFVEKSENVPVVVKYFTPSCDNCKETDEAYDELVIKFLMEESEDVKFAEVNCMDLDSIETCMEEGIEDYPAIHLYKNGMVEDIFDDTPSVDTLSNFVWQTVDPTRVTSNNDIDDFLNLATMMGGMTGGQEEFEECDCSDPDCECEDEPEDEYADEELDEEQDLDEEEDLEEDDTEEYDEYDRFAEYEDMDNEDEWDGNEEEPITEEDVDTDNIEQGNTEDLSESMSETDNDLKKDEL